MSRKIWIDAGAVSAYLLVIVLISHAFILKGLFTSLTVKED